MTSRNMAAQSSTLRKVVRGGLCSGCGACAAIAPDAVSMALVDPGYLRPQQSGELTLEQEARVAAACPGKGLTCDTDSHPMWGPLKEVRTGYATRADLRKHASSGGALSAILTHLLETGEIDAVIQTAAAPSLPLGNVTTSSVDADDIFSAAGSRYAPSAPLAGLEEHLRTGLTLAFVGKPCDVAALRVMQRQDPRLARRIPVVLSFFCAGIPSLSGGREILRRMGVDEGEVVDFRYRGDGWPGFARATLKDGSQRQISYSESWGGILTKHVQFRCRVCADGVGTFADIVCGDAWEVDANGYPSFDERDGKSLIITRTEKGERIVGEAEASGRVRLSPFDTAQLRDIQPGQKQRRQNLMPRLLALQVLRQEAPKYRGFHLLRNAITAGPTSILRNFAGTCLRVLKGRTREQPAK